ncbi:MAG: GntR family transcriptional regulator [Janthinobacterium lividum]
MSTVATKLKREEPPVAAEAVPGSNKIVRKTTVDLVTDGIRKMILNGKLAPGEALRQELLAEEFGVSRAPIREAITRLSSEGLLTVFPHRGAYVCELSVEEVRETFDIRLRLEPWLFAEAVLRISDAEIDKAERLITEMDQVDGAEWGHLNWRLHETFYRPAQKDITLEMLRVLHDRSDRYFRYQVVKVPIREQSHAEHMQLVDACRARDAKKGAKVLEQHIRVAAQQMVSIVQDLV